MSEPIHPSREKHPTPMKGIGFVLVIILIAVAIGLFALNQRPAEGPRVATEPPVPISVATAKVELADQLALQESFSGLTVPRRSSALGFSGSGRIAQINVDVGDRVTRGQTLAQLDTRSLRARLTAAEANVSEARAASKLAQTTVRRQSELFSRGHVAQQAVDQAEAEADTATARIDAAQAQADTLRVDIDLSTITAPFEGTITARTADEGAIAAPGQSILELVESGQIEARIGLPADAVGSLQIGQTYALKSAVGSHPATLRAITGVIDARRRTVSAVFDLLEPGAVTAGAVVRLSLDRTITERGFWVPVSALSEANRGLWSIYALERQQGGGWITAQRTVEIVHSEGENAFVRGTLSEGEIFVSEGLQRLTPGQAVLPRETVTAAHGSAAQLEP